MFIPRRVCFALGLWAVAFLICVVARAANATEGSAGHGRRTLALLVGVSEYPALAKSLQLAGPRSDVRLMRSLLLERDFAEFGISILADGVAGAAMPTRDNILTELDRLGAAARSGDTVVLYFAGHGSQQPAEVSGAGSNETGGLSAIFLPRDVGMWQPRPGRPTGSVKNAITDREFRERVDRISRGGAHVWAIFDACHSATLVRGDDDDDPADDHSVRLRRVRPQQLGIPPAAGGIGEPAVRAASTDTRLNAPAGAVYFYASQTTESTPELRLPPRSSEAVHHGLFTYVLAQATAGGGGMTYRQLAQSILVRYAAMQDGGGVTPQFAGNALDRAVLGRSAEPVRQWRLRFEDGKLLVGAGQLADIHPGSVFAVMPLHATKLEQTLGYVRVVSASVNSAETLPVAHAGVKEKKLEALSSGVIGRLVSATPKLGLAVVSDLSNCAKPCPFGRSIQVLQNAGLPGIEWVAHAGSADLRLVAVDSRLWLLPASVPGRPCRVGSPNARQLCTAALSRRSPSIEATPGASEVTLAEVLSRSLQTAGRAVALLRSASAVAMQPAMPFEPEVSYISQRSAPQPFREGTVPEFVEGDRVLVRWRNVAKVPIDVTALYLDARYGIQTLYPPPGAMNRIDVAAEAGFELQLNVEQTDGLEHLILITVPARRHEERADFSFWAQDTLPAAQVVRGGPSDAAVVRVLTWQLGR
jgi:hypothetical protein